MTDKQRWLSRKYLAYQTLKHSWFISAVWLYFYRLFITDQQVGFLDGMAFTVGLLAEVPSGALADRFGRDKMTKLGQVLVGGGLIFQALGSSFMPFFVGQVILLVGASFVSGADEALFFKQLNFERNSSDWRKLVTRGSQFGIASSVVATLIGGWLHTINPRVPWFITGAIFIASALVIFSVKETRVISNRKKLSVEIKHYLNNIKEGFSQFRLPKLWLYVPIIITVQGLFYTAGWGLLRMVLLDRFHFSPIWGSVVVATSSVITVLILSFMHKHADRLSEKRVIALISFSAVAGILLSVADIGAWGYFVILALYAGEHILYPFMSEILNNHAPEKQRATVLSVGAFLRMLPYIGLAPLIGYLNTQKHLEYFLIGWAGLIFVAILLYLSLKKRDEQVKF